MPGVAGVVGLHTNIIQYKYTIRSIVCKASCHSVTRSLGHLVTRSLDHLVTWSPSHSVTRSLGHLVTWSLGHILVIMSLFFSTWPKRTNGQTDKRTNRQTDEQHQGLQVCFADNKDSILAGRRTVSIFIIIL